MIPNCCWDCLLFYDGNCQCPKRDTDRECPNCRINDYWDDYSETSDCSTDTTTNNVVLQLIKNKKIVTDSTESELSDCETTKEVVE